MRSASTSRSQLGAIVDSSDRKENEMNRRVWAGVAAGLLAALVLLTVGFGGYQAGRDDDGVTTEIVRENGENNDGQVVHVVHEGRHWGPGPGFFLFPLLIIFLVFAVARGRWHRHYGHWGPGHYRPGYWGGDPESQLQEWHRRQHEGGADPGAGSDPEATTPSEP
jgi:hypothetical protein